jgi:signal transduction histidine kinase
MQRGHRFFTRILLPTLVAVLLFLAATFLLVIPTYRESLMEGKRETIRELTNTAWSVMQKLDLMVDTVFVLGEAQHEAALIIGDMRYGPEQKDYFWITDTIPVMVMHPYRPTMIGMDLSDYRDNQGKNFFVDIVNIVKEDGDGYIDYKWQWKDDSLTVVSKLSYVKAYEPWGWIVGTGIYIDDVNREIASLSRKVIWISVLATLMLGALIAYLARRSYIAELERQKAQERLRDSMERYKKLVESSTDGVMMMIENEIVYINPYLLQLFGYSEEDFDRHDPGFFEVLASFISEAGPGPRPRKR